MRNQISNMLISIKRPSKCEDGQLEKISLKFVYFLFFISFYDKWYCHHGWLGAIYARVEVGQGHKVIPLSPNDSWETTMNIKATLLWVANQCWHPLISYPTQQSHALSSIHLKPQTNMLRTKKGELDCPHTTSLPSRRKSCCNKTEW
jgi:hypothetical protein